MPQPATFWIKALGIFVYLLLGFSNTEPCAAQWASIGKDGLWQAEPKAISVAYANDLFLHTDRYYSQGIDLRINHPGLKKNPLFVLLPAYGSNRVYSVQISHRAYTPSSILSDSILHHDYPYSAHIAIQNMVISRDSLSRRSLSAALVLGWIGPAALGYEMQSGLHALTGNDEPRGWQYQIRNGPVLSYNLNLCQEIIQTKFLMLSASAGVRLGTLFTDASVGVSASLGWLPKPGQGKGIYLHARAGGMAVGYDATLQGNVFLSDPYTLHSAEISRLPVLGSLGLVVTYRPVTIAYTQVWRTAHFKGGLPHAWGTVTCSIAL